MSERRTRCEHHFRKKQRKVIFAARGTYLCEKISWKPPASGSGLPWGKTASHYENGAQEPGHFSTRCLLGRSTLGEYKIP